MIGYTFPDIPELALGADGVRGPHLHAIHSRVGVRSGGVVAPHHLQKQMPYCYLTRNLTFSTTCICRCWLVADLILVKLEQPLLHHFAPVLKE